MVIGSVSLHSEVRTELVGVEVDDSFFEFVEAVCLSSNCLIGFHADHGLLAGLLHV